MSPLQGILATYRATSQSKRVIFHVPGLNLLAQTLTEWPQEGAIPLRRGPACRLTRQGHPFL